MDFPKFEPKGFCIKIHAVSCSPIISSCQSVFSYPSTTSCSLTSIMINNRQSQTTFAFVVVSVSQVVVIIIMSCDDHNCHGVHRHPHNSIWLLFLNVIIMDIQYFKKYYLLMNGVFIQYSGTKIIDSLLSVVSY